MEPFIRNLVRYQQFNLEIASLDTRLSALPSELEALDKKEQEAASAIQSARQHHEECLKSRRRLESDLKDLEQQIDKYNDQSRQVKTNDQYRAIMSEIQNVKTHIGEVEEKILISMEEADALERQIGEAEKEVATRKKEIGAARRVLTDEAARVKAQRDALDADRQAVAGSVPSDLMDAYVRVNKIRGEVVMAAVRDERCTACNVRLRPALVAEVRKNDALHQCESCHRLLYLLPPAPATDASAGPVGSGDAAPEGPPADTGGEATPDPGAS